MRGLRASLRIEEFRALLVSYVINRAGDFVGSIALALIVLGSTGSALATAVLFLATQFLPGILGPVVVARVDRLALPLRGNRRRHPGDRVLRGEADSRVGPHRRHPDQPGP